MKRSRRLPAEWEPQDGVLMAWPHIQTDWADDLAPVEAVYLELTRIITRYERVVIIAPHPETVREQLDQAAIEAGRVTIAPLPTNDTWSRDFGPICVEESGLPLVLDFGFNGWGLKFAADLDNQITHGLCTLGVLAPPRAIPGLILEGGSIESDGQGTLLTTSECLLNPNRNPHLGREALDTRLREIFGCEQILWLEHGFLAGDDTDSHIDTLARLAPHNTILHIRCDDPDDEHFAAIEAMERQLSTFRTLDGEPFRLLPLPWPRPIYAAGGERLPATYANYLIINGAVLVPTYQDPADGQALETLAQAYPEREIIGIDCRPLVQQHGSLHCVTMQLPKGVLS